MTDMDKGVTVFCTADFYEKLLTKLLQHRKKWHKDRKAYLKKRGAR